MNPTTKPIIDTITVTVTAIKELVHDIRSPLSSIKIRVLFSSHIHGTARNLLEQEVIKISQILDGSSRKYSDCKDVLTAIEDLIDELSVPLSTMRICIASLNNIDRDEQSFLYKELNRTSGILDSSIQKYSNDITVSSTKNELVSASQVITNIITEKKSEYQNQPIQFRYNFTKNSESALIRINQSDLERALSNIINNSADAFNGKNGIIDINLSKRGDGIKITISDNGCGIPPEVIAKIRSNEMVTHGKAHGNGIGYKQIRETLAKNGAMLSIESNQDLQSTTVTLSFPDPENIK